MAREIVWALTREQFAEGRKILPGAVNSTLNLFDKDAEKAESVAIVRGHPKTEACAAFYKKLGADVVLFGDEPEVETKKPARKKADAE